MNTVYDVIIVGTGAAGFQRQKRSVLSQKGGLMSPTLFWPRAAYVCCGVRKTTKIILKTP